MRSKAGEKDVIELVASEDIKKDYPVSFDQKKKKKDSDKQDWKTE